tara:strand:+ start:123 stop:716 length:594 start_codon:yes stop_codon:yes gene_type:complete
MPIGINGNGTITGVIVGGLPDGIVDTDMLAANAVTPAKASGIGGKFASYAIIADQKANDVDGGTFTTGAWRTRDLNTELADPDGIVSISSNQFTLQAGSYLIEAQAPCFQGNRHMIKLYQTSGTPADIAFGTGEYANSSYSGNTSSFLKVRVTISSATTYEIRHRNAATRTTLGFGLGSDFDNNTELYTVVKIFKEV